MAAAVNSSHVNHYRNTGQRDLGPLSFGRCECIHMCGFSERVKKKTIPLSQIVLLLGIGTDYTVKKPLSPAGWTSCNRFRQPLQQGQTTCLIDDRGNKPTQMMDRTTWISRDSAPKKIPHCIRHDSLIRSSRIIQLKFFSHHNQITAVENKMYFHLSFTVFKVDLTNEPLYFRSTISETFIYV